MCIRDSGSFVSASCTCPFNENGEGPCCKHIGALLLHEVDEPEEKMEPKPEKKALLDIPGVQRGTEFAKEAAARKDSYVSGLEMLFGRKWRGDEPVSDVQAQELLRAYQEDALAEVESLTASDGQQRGFAELEPELILDYSGQPPLLRLRISDGGRQYVVKSIQMCIRDRHKGSSAFRRVIKAIVYTVPSYIIHYKRQKTLPEESKRMKPI